MSYSIMIAKGRILISRIQQNQAELQGDFVTLEQDKDAHVTED